MAGALVSAKLKVNNSNGEVLTVDPAGTIASTINLAVVADGRGVLQSQSSDKKAFLLNTVTLEATDADGAVASKTMYIASELHKQVFCSTDIGQTGTMVSETTTMQDFFSTGSNKFRIRVWMPYYNNAGSWLMRTLDSDALDDLFENIRFCAKLDYVDESTAKVKYVDLGIIDGEKEWVTSGSGSPSAHVSAVTPQTSVSSGARAYAEKDIDFSLSARVFSLFGLSLGDVDGGSQMKITLLGYVGAPIATPTATMPPGASVVSTIAATGAIYCNTQNRVTGENLLSMSVANADTIYNGETYVGSGDLGWVSNYNTSGTTDTSITINITSPS